MDHTTTEVRLASWRTMIEQCQQRPEGMTIKQWLQDNNINRDQYFYYQRRLRQAAFAEAEESHLPAVWQKSEVAFAELPSETVSVACVAGTKALGASPLTVDTGVYANLKVGQCCISKMEKVASDDSRFEV